MSEKTVKVLVTDTNFRYKGEQLKGVVDVPESLVKSHPRSFGEIREDKSDAREDGEVKKENTALKKKNTALEKKVGDLEGQIKDLESQLEEATKPEEESK